VTDRGRVGNEAIVPTLSIVLGTLNERAALPELIGRLNCLELPPHELIVVDDGSTDGTREYVHDLATTDSRVRLLCHNGPRTLIPAQTEGIEAARANFVVIMDSDLQHPPEKIPEIYRHLSGGAGLVIASRYDPAGSAGDRSPFRSVISKGAEFIVKLLIREARPVSDPLSGFYGLRRSLFRPPVPMHKGYHMLPYLLVLCSGTKIREVPYLFGLRLNGKSKVTQNLEFIRIFLGQMLITVRIRSALGKRNPSRKEIRPKPDFSKDSPASAFVNSSSARPKPDTTFSGSFTVRPSHPPGSRDVRREDSLHGHDSP